MSTDSVSDSCFDALGCLGGGGGWAMEEDVCGEGKEGLSFLLLCLIMFFFFFLFLHWAVCAKVLLKDY